MAATRSDHFVQIDNHAIYKPRPLKCLNKTIWYFFCYLLINPCFVNIDEGNLKS